MDIDGLEAEDILIFELLLLFRVSFFLWMGLEIILNNACEGSVSSSSGDLFSALDTTVFFVGYQLREAAPTEAVVAGLDHHWNAHDLVAERTSYLILDQLREVYTYRFVLLFYS